MDGQTWVVRQTDGHTIGWWMGRPTVKQMDGWTDIQKDGWIVRWTGRQMRIQMVRWTDTNELMDSLVRQIDGRMDIWMNGQMDGQSKPTDGQTDS